MNRKGMIISGRTGKEAGGMHRTLFLDYPKDKGRRGRWFIIWGTRQGLNNCRQHEKEKSYLSTALLVTEFATT